MTTKAEYIATSEAGKEAIWLHRRTANFSNTSGINQQAPTIYCDSLSAIHLINNPVYHAKKKHIRYHHIREIITEKKLKVWKIDIKVNIADCLTKPLPDLRFGALRTKMGLRQATKQKKAERGAEGKI